LDKSRGPELLFVVQAVAGSSPVAHPHESAAQDVNTHDHWDVRQPWPGIYLWRDPYGTHYLVDHTGTRRLNAA
jgi:hypothetical protein